MACLINSAITRNCQFILGGIDRIWFGNRSVLSAATSSSITFTSTASTINNALFEIEMAPNTAFFNSEMQVANGKKYVLQTVSLQLDSIDVNSLAQIPNYALGKLFALVKDRSANYYIIARNGYGLQSTVASVLSGPGAGDAGGTLTFTNEATEYPIVYTGTVPA